MKLTASFLAATTLALAAWSTPTRADMTLVDAATPPCPIIYNARDKAPAIELASYLKQISGKDFELKPYAEPLPARAIMVGDHSNAPLAQLGEDGFIVRTKGEQIFIMGGGAQGTFYGVFDFLEKQLGCRWWSWTEEDVPTRAEIKLGAINAREIPVFKMHDIMSWEAQANGNDFKFKSRAKSYLQFTANHSLYPLLTAAAKENPEFWPMDAKGVRAPNNLHLNYLAPGIDQALADALSKVVEQKGGDLKNWIYFAGQGDWFGGLDQSEESKKAYAEDGGSFAGPLVSMMNKTGAILEKKYPGIQVGTFAYMTTDVPPAKTRPAENVNIWLPRLRYGTTLGIEESLNAQHVNEDLRTRSGIVKKSIETWAKIAPGRLYIWEYGANFNNYMMPWPSLRSMAQNIKFYKKAGVAGIVIQANYSSLGGDLAILKNWVWAKLLWNPDQDTSTLVKQFCDGYYGPASQEIQEYVNTLEDSVRTPKLLQFDEFTNSEWSKQFRTPEVRAKMQAAIDRARAKTQGEANVKYRQRVNEAAATMEAEVLWTPASLVEKDGKLIRADIDKENGGAYTHDRAMLLMKSLRGAGKSEMSDGRTQVRGLISGNGGPLYTMTQGKVTAKVAPYQGLNRLWKVFHDGKEIIDGSFCNMSIYYMEPVGTPTGERVEMQGDAGFAHWDPKAYLKNKEVITQDADGTLHWDFQYEQLVAGKPDMKPDRHLTAIIGTVYPAPTFAAAEKYIVEINTGEGWKRAPLEEVAVFPTILPLPRVEDLQIRVTTPDGKTVVVDSYKGVHAVGYGIAYAHRHAGWYGHKNLVTWVIPDEVPLELNKTVPAFKREIKFETPAPVAVS